MIKTASRNVTLLLVLLLVWPGQAWLTPSSLPRGSCPPSTKSLDYGSVTATCHTTKSTHDTVHSALRSCISTVLLSVGMLLLPLDSQTASAAMNDFPSGQRYWSIMEDASIPQKVQANEALLDYAVGTINTQFYDNTGGAFFTPKEFYGRWKLFQRVASGQEPPTSFNHLKKTSIDTDIPTRIHLDTRDGAVAGLKWLVGSLNDPFSKYLTREELREELQGDTSGFLGTGAVVEASRKSNSGEFASFFRQPIVTTTSMESLSTPKRDKKFLTNTRAANLPVVTAVAPDSPSERLGLVVGDRIVAVGEDSFLGRSREEIEKRLKAKYNQKDYFGQVSLTIAKPVYAAVLPSTSSTTKTNEQTLVSLSSSATSRNVVLGYRQTRVRLATKADSEPVRISSKDEVGTASRVAGGDAVVHYELLTSESGSIFDHLHSEDKPMDNYRVGYIRLTRFSKASTAGYVEAIQALESAGAQSYILDLRNNYGGVIQEAMLTASTLLRDPHSIVCYTMNARGGFTPHDAEEYIVDKRYPGYFLSSESPSATIDQVQKENPAMFVDNGIAWDPPSSFASLHEQVTKRGVRRISYVGDITALLESDPVLKSHFRAQKKIVLLINEGTASAAEVFAAALRDNARTVALVGTKTYGKGLIQHTFPMPDGGGLRITVAEYLTPALRHVTKVGGARFDRNTGELVGGGIQPDILCESKQGIPQKISADLCVGVALDVLEEASESTDTSPAAVAKLSGITSQLLGSSAGKR